MIQRIIISFKLSFPLRKSSKSPDSIIGMIHFFIASANNPQAIATPEPGNAIAPNTPITPAMYVNTIFSAAISAIFCISFNLASRCAGDRLWSLITSCFIQSKLMTFPSKLNILLALSTRKPPVELSMPNRSKMVF